MTHDDDSMESGPDTGRGEDGSVGRFVARLLTLLRERPAGAAAWVCVGDADGLVLWDLSRLRPATASTRRRPAQVVRELRTAEFVEGVDRIVVADAGARYFAALVSAALWRDRARAKLTGAQVVRLLRRELRGRRRRPSSSPTDVTAQPSERSVIGRKTPEKPTPSARLVGVPELTKKLVALGEVDRSGDPVTAQAVRTHLARPGNFPPEYAALAGGKVRRRYPERAALAFLAAAARRLRVDREERSRIEAEIAALRRRTRAERG